MEIQFEAVWERIRQITGWKRYGDLAEFLSITSASVSGAKSKGVIPFEWVFKVASHYRIYTDWLLTGEGQKFKEAIQYDRELLIVSVNCLEKVFNAYRVDINWKDKGDFVIDFYEQLTRYGVKPEQINLIEKEAFGLVKLQHWQKRPPGTP